LAASSRRAWSSARARHRSASTISRGPKSVARGQIVTIKGTVDADGSTGTATQVTFDADLRGAVSGIDTSGQDFTVLGQTARITDDTLFDESIQPASLGGLHVGTVVQVSGTMNSVGEIVASRVDVADASATLQVRAVASLDTSAHTFRINSLIVDYGTVAPADGLANMRTVLVRGTLSSQGALLATRIQVVGSLGAAANETGRIEGLITAFVSNNDFTIDGQRVTTDATTQLDLAASHWAWMCPSR